MMDEAEVLEAQLEELLAEGATDIDDVLEIASVAGMLARLGASPEALAAAVAWRDGPAQELLAELWADIDPRPFVDQIEGLADGEADEDRVREAVFDFDEVVAAALWCGQRKRVAKACTQVAKMVRLVPDSFAEIAALGSDLSRLPQVGHDLEIYDYWLAIADAAQWA